MSAQGTTPARRAQESRREGLPARLRGAVLSADGRALIGVAVLAVALLVVFPLVLSDFRLSLLGRYLTVAMVAVGIGLAWGRGGMLTMGQGVFFGLGAYMMAMHLKLASAGPGGVPDFMQLYGTGTVPGWWEPFRSPAFTVVAIVLVPALVAGVIGYAIFRRAVRGAYFAVLSQALAAAFAILLVGQQQTTGGTNGLNGFRDFFGYDLHDPANKRMLYFIAATVLLAMVLVTWQLRRSRFGELLVAVRDQENRVKFLGYDPALVKTTGYAIAAVFAAIGGALFVPIVGIISPADVGVVPSIEYLAGVAIGGRATLLGPVLGSIGVAWAGSSLSESFPAAWTYFQGLMFIVVVGFLSDGLAGIPSLLRGWISRRRTPAPAQDDRPEGEPRGPAASTDSVASEEAVV